MKKSAAVPMDAFIRLKVSTASVGGVPDQHKMLALSATTSWGSFKAAAAAKFGFTSAVQFEFQWEQCTIDEPNEKALVTFVKDGDTITMLQNPQNKGSTCKSEEDGEDTGPASLGGAPAGQGVVSLRNDHAQGDVATAESGEQEGMLPGRATSMEGAAERPSYKTMAMPLPAAMDVRYVGMSATANDLPQEAEPLRERMESLQEPLMWGSQPEAGPSNNDRRCTCKHSRCVKLYCVCFAAGVMCNNCLCQECFNTPENEDFLRSEQARAKSRNPLAFSLKVEQGGDGSVSHKIGCRCRKSHCIKKYCECFDGGVRCSVQCRCTDCFNNKDEPAEDGGLASLACAAQLASGCLDDSGYLMSPETAAAVAPYLPRDPAAAAAQADPVGLWPRGEEQLLSGFLAPQPGYPRAAKPRKKRRSSTGSGSGQEQSSGSGGEHDNPAYKAAKVKKGPMGRSTSLPVRKPTPTQQHPGSTRSEPETAAAGTARGVSASSRFSSLAGGGSALLASMASHPSGLPKPSSSRHQAPGAYAVQGPAGAAAGGAAAGHVPGGSIMQHLQQQQLEQIFMQQQQQLAMMGVGVGYPNISMPGSGSAAGSYLVMCPGPGQGAMGAEGGAPFMMMPLLAGAGSLPLSSQQMAATVGVPACSVKEEAQQPPMEAAAAAAAPPAEAQHSDEGKVAPVAEAGS